MTEPKPTYLPDAKELKRSDLERAFETRWRQLAPPDAPEPVAEYRFSEERRFRFDFAWPAYKVALELHGATWTGGRHVRGAGFRSDCEKMNLAQLGGWIVLQATSGMLKDDPQGIVEDVLVALELHGQE